MTHAIRCFAGANTPSGFFSYFHSIFDGCVRVFYLKGGPGMGKSSLMKRIAERQQTMGHEVSLFYCSSDPASLDGMVDETSRCAVLDATAPHVCDPFYPGARDTLVSLGDYLNEPALRREKSEIERLQAEIAREFRASSFYLAAAANVRECARIEPDPVQAQKAVNTLAERLTAPKNESRGIGAEKRFFLSAHTCKGEIHWGSQFSPGITVRILTPFGGNADAVLRLLENRARESGVSVLAFPDPLDPSRLNHLYFPDLPLFVTSDDLPCAEILSPFPSDECAPDPLYADLLEKAHAQIARAKAMHDELETLYTPQMDFSRLTQAETRIISGFDEAFPEASRTNSEIFTCQSLES